MDRYVQNQGLRKKQPRIGRAKVRTGCRTCKIRRIKCDEGRPACHRCVSTGRVCDGYGIWGGGGNSYGNRSDGLRSLKDEIPSTVLAPRYVVSTEERGAFKWFIHQSVIKLPGAFRTGFWDKLLFQAIAIEPAVLHATLALSSAHRGVKDEGQGVGMETGNLPDKQEQFTLTQYSKAISHLQPHLSIKDRTSIRVALIACVIFISLEFLRGHYKTGNNHLQNGVKLIRELEAQPREIDDYILISKPSREFTDDWIIEAFARLYLQAQLFGQGHGPFYVIHPPSTLDLAGPVFQSAHEARQLLDRLLNEILYLTEQSRQESISPSLAYPSRLVDEQQRVQVDLASWFKILKASKSNQQVQMTPRDLVSYKLLEFHHTMAEIMAATCLLPAGDSKFDSQISNFVSIIAQSIGMRKIASSKVIQDALHKGCVEHSNSILDMGGIPPLYFTALKCRNHRVRLQAIRLLNSRVHKEGIWDAALASCIAKEVMRIEEQDFYKDFYLEDDFSLSSIPNEQDLLLPTIPESSRVHDLQVILPDERMGKVILICTHQLYDGIEVDQIREYDPVSNLWTDGSVPTRPKGYTKDNVLLDHLSGQTRLSSKSGFF